MKEKLYVVGLLAAAYQSRACETAIFPKNTGYGVSYSWPDQVSQVRLQTR